MGRSDSPEGETGHKRQPVATVVLQNRSVVCIDHEQLSNHPFATLFVSRKDHPVARSKMFEERKTTVAVATEHHVSGAVGQGSAIHVADPKRH
ncbi:MAG: hypothetical protein OES25_01245 [Acidobacteriota bacterium]|nr:hypothetical protein [Acidobacteriota bacterium]